MTAKSEGESSVNVAEQNGSASGSEETVARATTVKVEDRGHPERKRRASNESVCRALVNLNITKKEMLYDLIATTTKMWSSFVYAIF